VGNFLVQDLGPGSYDVYVDGLPSFIHGAIGERYFIKEVQFPVTDMHLATIATAVTFIAQPRRMKTAVLKLPALRPVSTSCSPGKTSKTAHGSIPISCRDLRIWEPR
jgi:hypothetical protein